MAFRRFLLLRAESGGGLPTDTFIMTCPQGIPVLALSFFMIVFVARRSADYTPHLPRFSAAFSPRCLLFARLFFSSAWSGRYSVLAGVPLLTAATLRCYFVRILYMADRWPAADDIDGAPFLPLVAFLLLLRYSFAVGRRLSVDMVWFF